jgi:polyisoprenoid-binding protein YceI
MARDADLGTRARSSGDGSPRRHRPLRWLLGAAAVVVVLVVLAVALFLRQPAPPPLTLAGTAAAAPAGPLDGTWNVAAGSLAGFRVQETVLGLSNDVVGRTGAVTGDIVISGGRVTAAAFRIHLTAVRVGGKTQPQFGRSLGAQAHPSATFTLAPPAALSPGFASGAAVTMAAAGHLAMHGTSRLVNCTITARRDGPVLQAAGSIPVAFARWGSSRPAGFAFLGSLASRGAAEFLLDLRRH